MPFWATPSEGILSRLQGFWPKGGLSFGLAVCLSVGSATQVIAQSGSANAQAVANLVKTACIFDTMNPLIELPRSHTALKVAGLPLVNQGPQMALYGDTSGTYFMSNLTDDDDIACTANITLEHMGLDGFRYLAQEIENLFSARYSQHAFIQNDNGYDWIARHGNGTGTAVTILFHKKSGTIISSITTLDD